MKSLSRCNIMSENKHIMKKFLFSIFISLTMLSLFGQNKNNVNVIFEPTSYNFGDVTMWENQPALFKVVNNMKEPLIFLPLFNEVDLEVRLPDRPLAPGESMVIEAIYYTAGKGSFTRKFNIFMGHTANPVELKITGNIKALSPNAYQQCPTLKPQTAKGKIEVTGKSFNKETRQEISEALVYIQGMTDKSKVTLLSDKSGNFISKLSGGSYELWVEKDGFQPYKTTFFVGNSVINLELALVPSAPLQAKVPEKVTFVDDTPEKSISNESADQNIPNNKNEITISKQEEVQVKQPLKVVIKDEEIIPSKQVYEKVEKLPEPEVAKVYFEKKPEEKPIANVTASSSINLNTSITTESKLPLLAKNISETNNINPFSNDVIVAEKTPKKEVEEEYYYERVEIIKNDDVLEEEQQILISEKAAELNEPEIEKVVFYEDFLAQEKMDSLQNFITQLLNEKAEVENKLNELKEQKLAEKVVEKEVFIAQKEEIISQPPYNPELSRTEYSANNIIFLIDISSSMAKENKMELLKQAMKNLVPSLRDIDRVAIIAYNQRTYTMLESVKGTDKNLIINAIDSLVPRGLTYGVNGIQDAYNILETYYVSNGNNQIILATDGLFSEVNQTITERQLQKLVKDKATKQGIKLSVVGFGSDPVGDALMTNLALSGSGKFIKIRNQWDAESVLIEEIKVNSQIK